MLKRLLYLLTITLLIGQFADAQVTTSSISGFVKSATNEPLVGATITATHQPTGTVYRTQTKNEGKFDINNMNPGGPYTIVVTYVNLSPVTRSEVYLTLGESSKQDFILTNQVTELTTVTVTSARASANSRGGVETNIGRDRITNMPTVGRNISDLLRSVPQAKLTSTEGAISIAGQNNRYNAFYIDGALNNDVFGLSASGTNGGQANIAPISLDAIDQIQVVISPYDAALSGFTGGGINAITKSGTNKFTGTAYYLFRNQDLAGKTPTGPKETATKFNKFQNKTYGVSFGGPIIKNKLFFFFNGEIQHDVRPQPFDTAKYQGNTKPYKILAFADTLRARYGYEPGGFFDNPEKVNAKRAVAKVDWSITDKTKLSLSYRYNYGERYNTSSSTATSINFFNNGYIFPTTSNTVSAELRSNFTRSSSNRLLLTYANIKDDRSILGQAFPRVRINDGSGSLFLGPDNSSTINLLTQKNYNLLDNYKFSVGKHAMSVGVEAELNNDYNAFIQNTYGNYTYASLADFYNNAKPSAYSVGYPLIDNKTDETTSAAAKFKIFRYAAFYNDEFRPNDRITLNFGIRADKSDFITKPATDTFTNNTALPIFARYYDLQGARSGQKPNIPVSISPRFGLVYKIPSENITVRFGAGLFTGRIPLVWPGGIYNNNGLYVGGFSASASDLNTIRFRSDPFNQWRPSDIPGSSITKGPLNLISKDFKLPKVFRTSLGMDKQLGKGWSTSLEGFYTKNINETGYTNIALLPPSGTSTGPGSRNVYPATATIPINGSTRVYDNAILLSNATTDRGYSYTVTATIDKRFRNGFAASFNYSYGDAIVAHEPTSSVNFSQWRFVETVNGRNYIQRSISDFALGHRIYAYASKKFSYAKFFATTVTLDYNGQSGSPFSYVYSGAVVRDDPSGGNDLLYVPTAADIQGQTFLSNTISGVTYTPQQQKDALEAYITNNKYLNKHRGQFAERNGDRLPFYHIIDAKVAQDFNLKIGGRTTSFQITYDIFNFTNMLNRKWGRTYFMSNDQFSAISFAGYVSNTNLTPQYRFNPNLAQPKSENFVSTSSAPSFSARWTSQVGLRLNF